jgi:carbonic anhydrase
MFPRERFADVLAANERYAADFTDSDMAGRAAQGLAIVTCMDSRVDPLRVVGMQPGDVKTLCNAGARVTDEILRTLVIAAYLLEVDRVLVMPHTRCKMASATEEQIHETIEQQYGVNTRLYEFRTTTDQEAALRYDLQRIRSNPLLPPDLVAAGAIYDVDTGVLTPLDD